MAQPDPVTDMLAEGRLERVPTNRLFVGERLTQAGRHLKTATDAARDNPAGSLSLAYDAARFSVDAHLNANGLRATNRPGAHRATVAYARAKMGGVVAEDDLATYDAMRDVRNTIDYPPLTSRGTVNYNDAARAITVARRMLDATTGWWLEREKAPRRRR